jgi:hypothetical protein
MATNDSVIVGNVTFVFGKNGQNLYTGTAAMISPDDARTAIATAENFVAVVRRALKP